jgi:hypothetical protein
MPKITINSNRRAVYDVGAVLLSLLAHPPMASGDKDWKRLQRTLCHVFLKDRSERDPEWARRRQSIKPIYAFVPEKEAKRNMRTLDRRLRDRMAAARVAIAFLQEAKLGVRPPTLPKSVKRLSVNQMADLVCDDAGMSSPENFETRVWRPSLPVIHLAAALQVLLQDENRAGRKLLSWGNVMQDRGIVKRVIREAEEYRGLIAKSPRLKIKPKVLVRVRLTHH